jgi:hypothetical protein
MRSVLVTPSKTNGNLGSRSEDMLRDRLQYAHHRTMLIEESGISPTVVAERGYNTAKTKAELARLGFSKPQRREPALVVPMYSPAGELVTHQIRPDAPRKNKGGKPIKYETPVNSPIRLDVHPSQTEWVKDASVPLWITEGSRRRIVSSAGANAPWPYRACGAGRRTACLSKTGRTSGCGAAPCA